MKILSRFPTSILPPLLAVVLLPACEPPGPPAAPAPAITAEPLPEHLVERIDAVPGVDDAMQAEFEAVFVDDQLRVVTEHRIHEEMSATNHYLYFAGEPVFYRSSGTWQAGGAMHGIEAWAEFGLNGEPIGMEKRLDGSSVPTLPTEALAIRAHARALRRAAIDVMEPASCDFNKSLRSGDVLVTVIVPVGEACDSGLLRLYARTDNGSTVHEFDRHGRVDGAWLDDFNDDGITELLLAIDHDANETLRGWRIDGGRFTEIGFGDLTPAQQAGFGGENRYRVVGDKLLRQYRAADPARGSVRLVYNWANDRWLAQGVQPRGQLQARIAGEWQGPFRMEIPALGSIRVAQDCGELNMPALALPGRLLLVEAPSEAPESCDGQQMLLSPGTWLAETNGKLLRLTGLTNEQRLEFRAAPPDEKPPAGGSTGD